MLIQSDQKETQDLHIIKKKLIDLNNQLLKTFKISTIAFTVIKIVETMQMVYFLMRDSNQDNHWNYSVAGYFSIVLNLISLDNLISKNPAFFSSTLVAAVSSFLVMFLLCIVVAWNSGWGKKMPFLVKLSTPVIYIFLYLLKTILVIPASILVSISILPQAAQSYNIDIIKEQSSSLGSLLLVLMLIGTFYTLFMFREENPFSQLPYAGQSILKGLLWIAFKIGMAVIVTIDKNKSYLLLQTIIFTICYLFFIFEGHWQTGIYKNYSQKLEMLLIYFGFVLGLLRCFDMNGEQKTTLTYLLPFLLIAYLTYEWIVAKQIKSILTLNLQQNDDYKLLEKQVIYLINLIDGMNHRQNALLLQGYLHIHRRQCRGGQNCPCRKLVFLKQRIQSEVKLDFFKLVVSLLLDGRRKFMSEKKIDLLLCLIYHYRTKNYLQAIYSIYKMVKKDENSLQDRFYFSFYLQHIEREMAELDEKETIHSTDVNKYMDYTHKMVDLENNIQNCTRHHIEFWRLIMDSNPEIKRLEDLGTLITRSKQQLRQQFEIIYQANPNSIHLLTIYAKFQLQVTNEESYNVKYLQKAEAIYKNIKQSKKIDERSSKYNQNANTTVIIISGDQGQLGNIVHTNNLTKGMLGYKRSELLEKNVSMIMPKIYGESHHAVLTRYIAASQSKVNGMERLVPALSKEGFMLPVTALTKPLPSLTKGIEIIAFLAKYEQKSGDDDDNNRKINYILYRSDTQQIMGISQGCYKDYGISPALTYGNPFNLNNELKIKHIFGISFQKSDEGRIAAALEVGEVTITLNTKPLKDQFIVNKGGNSQKMLDQDDQALKEGVQMEAPLKVTLASVYNGIPLKLLAIYGKKSQINNRSSFSKDSRTSKLMPKVKKTHDSRKKQESIVEQINKNQTDDMKNLKDFKNFISIKREPSAITAISTICMFFMIIIAGAIIGLIIYWLQLMTLNSNALALYQLTLQTEISTPEILTQVEKQLIAYNNVTGFTSISSINSTTNYILDLLKRWQLQILPYKFYFNSAYNEQTTKYNLLSTGNLQTQQILQQALINEYLSEIQSLISSNISSLAQNNISTNIYQKYISSKLNYIFSIRPQYNSSNVLIGNWYNNLSTSRKNAVIAINMVMIGSVILWLILLLPYVLSVTKINNRVLSLFTLIPSFEVSRLIYNSLRFLNQNLSEAVVNPDDVKLYERNQDHSGVKQNFNESNSGSPSQFNLNFELTQGELRRPSQINRGNRESIVGVEERFQKMSNSEDRNKKITILKFMGISTLILAFILFYLLYSLNYISSLQTSINNYYLLGRRPALIRNIKFLLIQFLLNPNYQFSSNFSSVRTLNTNLISQFYMLQANLLHLNLGGSQNLLNLYNGADVCNQVSTFSAFSIFNQTLTTSQCYLFNSGVLQKGLTTGVVSVLEDIRSTLSQYTTSVPQNVLVSKILQYDLVVKYIETPMLAVAASVRDTINSTIDTTKFVMVLTGILFIGVIFVCWRFVWSRYLSELNVKIWRTKGLLNLIPMRIITSNDLLKNQFTSGQLQKAVR